MKRLLAIPVILMLLGGVAYAIGVTGSVDVWENFSSTFISSADNTVVKNTPGTLIRIKVSGGTLGDLVVYDNTTCEGTIVDNVVSADLADGVVMPYGRKMTTGICVYTSSAMKLVVIYK